MHTPRQSSVQQSSQQRKLTARYSKCPELLYFKTAFCQLLNAVITVLSVCYINIKNVV